MSFYWKFQSVSPENLKNLHLETEDAGLCWSCWTQTPSSVQHSEAWLCPCWLGPTDSARCCYWEILWPLTRGPWPGWAEPWSGRSAFSARRSQPAWLLRRTESVVDCRWGRMRRQREDSWEWRGRRVSGRLQRNAGYLKENGVAADKVKDVLLGETRGRNKISNFFGYKENRSMDVLYKLPGLCCQLSLCRGGERRTAGGSLACVFSIDLTVTGADWRPVPPTACYKHNTTHIWLN